eukprot:s2287_g12.t1
MASFACGLHGIRATQQELLQSRFRKAGHAECNAGGMEICMLLIHQMLASTSLDGASLSTQDKWSPRITCFGEAMLRYVPDPHGGEDSPFAAKWLRSVGGAELNITVALSRLGWGGRSRWVSVVPQGAWALEIVLGDDFLRILGKAYPDEKGSGNLDLVRREAGEALVGIMSWTHGVGSELVRVVGHLRKHFQKRWRCRCEVAVVRVGDGRSGKFMRRCWYICSCGGKAEREKMVEDLLRNLGCFREAGSGGPSFGCKTDCFCVGAAGCATREAGSSSSSGPQRSTQQSSEQLPEDEIFEDATRRNEKLKTMTVAERLAFCAAALRARGEAWMRKRLHALGKGPMRDLVRKLGICVKPSTQFKGKDMLVDEVMQLLWAQFREDEILRTKSS